MKKIAWLLIAVMLLVPVAGSVLAEEFFSMVDIEGRYGSFIGTVVKTPEDGELFVVLEDANGERAGFVLTEEPYPYWLEGVELVEGAKVQIFYKLSLIAPMIFPPQYIAAVIAPVLDDALVFVGQFDADLVSLDGQLKLMNLEEVEIVDAAGEAFEGSLEGLTLVVVYGPSTRSIPAQTTPIRVIVLQDAPAEDIEVIA